MREMRRKNMENKNNQELTPAGLAKALGVRVETIARWKKDGCPYKEAKPYGRGATSTRPRYTLEQVKEWLKQQKENSRKEAQA